MRYLHFIIIITFSLAVSNSTMAKELDDQLFVFDTTINVLLENQNQFQLNDVLPISYLKKDYTYNVKLSPNNDIYCFSDEKLIKVIKASETFTASIEALRKQNLALISKKEETLVGIQIYHASVIKKEALTQEVVPRSIKGHFSNGFLILLILSVVMLAVVRVNYSTRFSEVFNLNRIFSLRPKEGDTNRLRVFDISGIVTGVVYLFICSTIITSFTYSNNISLFVFEPQSIFLALLINIFIIGLLLILKVIIVYAVSSVFQLNRINAFYIKELININLIFITAVLFISMATFLYWGYFPENYFIFLKVTLPALYLLRLILIYFKILKLSGFTNVYLFSYFCTTEVFPLIIGLKYFY